MTLQKGKRKKKLIENEKKKKCEDDGKEGKWKTKKETHKYDKKIIIKKENKRKKAKGKTKGIIVDGLLLF